MFATKHPAARVRVARLPEDYALLERARRFALELLREDPTCRAGKRAHRGCDRATLWSTRRRADRWPSLGSSRPYKGRAWPHPSGPRHVPTSDRVREALFSILGTVEAERVLDLYAGRAPRDRALSRGAKEQRWSTPMLRRSGRTRERRSTGHRRGTLRAADAGQFLKNVARRGEQWDLVFCDPPYRLAHRLGRDLEALLPPVLDQEARIVCESSTRQPLRLSLPLLTERRYGDTLVCIYRCSGVPE